VLAAEDFISKFEPSKTRKRKFTADKGEKAAERKKRRIEKEEAARAKLQIISRRRESFYVLNGS
jgi:hypothetical protein